MDVPSILTGLSGDLHRSLALFCPELVLCVTVVALLLFRLFNWDRLIPAGIVASIGSVLAFVAILTQFLHFHTGGSPAVSAFNWLYNLFGLEDSVMTFGPYFTGLLMHDALGIIFRLGLILFLVLVIALTVLTGIPDDEDGPEFYTLLVGSSIGMLLACTTSHLLMLFVAIEMMSVPSYAMVAFLKGRKQSSEAAFKYVVYGAGAAGVMLYGVSLVAGLTGTMRFVELAPRVTVLLQEGFTLTNPNALVLALGIMMVLCGLAFKLSLVPFHFWCPDAFEGAAAEVGGYLSVASKAAAFALLVRFTMSFDGKSAALQSVCLTFGLALGAIAALTATFGNLAAYTQTNLKRLLAYSTIAHAGYMLMAPAALLVLRGRPQVDLMEASKALEGLMYYLAVYLFMNLTAFAIIAAIRNETFDEGVDGYQGLINQGPVVKLLCVCLGISFFSLVGMPPFGGFLAKMMIFYSVFQSGFVHWGMWVVLAFGGLNTVFSLFYYLKVLKAIFMSPPTNDRRIEVPGVFGTYVLLVTIPIVLLGMSPLQHFLTLTVQQVAQSFLK